jgi:hypothetical protein
MFACVPRSRRPCFSHARGDEGRNVLWGDAPLTAGFGRRQLAAADHREHGVALEEEQVSDLRGAQT